MNVIEIHPQNRSARQWYEETPLEQDDLVFCRQTELGFVRRITQQRVMERCGLKALTNEEATRFLENACRDVSVSLAVEPSGTRALWLQWAQRNRHRTSGWMPISRPSPFPATWKW